MLSVDWEWQLMCCEQVFWCPVAEIEIDVVLLGGGGGARSKLPHIKVTPSEAGKDDVMWVASVSNGGRIVVSKGLVQFHLCRCSFSGLFGRHHFSKFPHCHLHVVLYPHSPYSEQLYVGVLLTTQPFFILGIEDVSEARSNAFGAMGMFMATFVLSLYGILRSRSAKEDIDNADGYQLSEFGSSRYD